MLGLQDLLPIEINGERTFDAIDSDDNCMSMGLKQISQIHDLVMH